MIFSNQIRISNELSEINKDYLKEIENSLSSKIVLEINKHLLFKKEINTDLNYTTIKLETNVYSPEQIKEIMNKLSFLELQTKGNIFIHSQIKELQNLLNN